MPTKPEQHKVKITRPREIRPNSADRGYGYIWRKLRLMALARDPVCLACGREEAIHADHIVPLAKGGGNCLENLQGLCASCHSRKTALEDGGFGRRKERR